MIRLAIGDGFRQLCATAMLGLLGGCGAVHDVGGRNVRIDHRRSDSMQAVIDLEVKAAVACGKHGREPVFVSMECTAAARCISYYRCL